MSWTLTIPYVPREEFDATVDQTSVVGQEGVAGVGDVSLVAREALKSLADHVRRPYVSGSAHGHVLQPDEQNYFDGVTVTVSGTSALPDPVQAGNG
jgi:hypothetical protein